MQIDQSAWPSFTNWRINNYYFRNIWKELARWPEKLIEQMEERMSSIHSRNTSYRWPVNNIGPRQLEKAEKLNIPIISEDDFLQLID